MEHEEQETAHLERFGLYPTTDELPAVREILRERVLRERACQGEGNSLLMRLCCVQLFCSAEPEDILLVWEAKEASFDAASSIEIQLLCGPGLESTKAYLRELGGPDASAALERLAECEATGDFADFAPESFRSEMEHYYGVSSGE